MMDSLYLNAKLTDVLLETFGIAKRKTGGVDVSLILSLWVPAVYLRVSDKISNIYDRNT